MNRIAILLLAMVSLQLPAFAQGPLTPPGAPAPTMKTLDQIEPRTPISALPYTIGSAGSYYLVSNLVGVAGQHGVTIATGNVTFDLNGFALSGGGGTWDGIYISGSLYNITIRNGTVTGWGSTGVDGWSGGYPRNVVYERLTVSQNATYGIIAEAASSIRDCLFFQNGGYGVYLQGGLIANCVARENGLDGIFATTAHVRDCQAEQNQGNGIHVSSSRVVDCVANNNTSAGIYASHSRISGCDVMNNGSNGLYIVTDCQVVNCRVDGNSPSVVGTAGINVYGPINWMEGNLLVNNRVGMVTTLASGSTSNMVVKNFFSGNTINAMQSWGTDGVADFIIPTDNFVTTNAWANFYK